jgi:hypothetical protein
MLVVFVLPNVRVEAYISAQGVLDHLAKPAPTPNGLMMIAHRFGGSIAFGAPCGSRCCV